MNQLCCPVGAGVLLNVYRSGAVGATAEYLLQPDAFEAGALTDLAVITLRWPRSALAASDHVSLTAEALTRTAWTLVGWLSANAVAGAAATIAVSPIATSSVLRE